MTSNNNEGQLYIAVILYESSSLQLDYKPLYQESFVLIHAKTQQEAEEKALIHAKSEQVSYETEDGTTITWSFKQIIDVNAVLYNDFLDGTELYSRHFRNYDAYCLFEPLLSGEL